MNREEAIKKRAAELIKGGMDPEAAFTTAILEQLTKEQDDRQAEEDRKMELERLVKEGRQTVNELKGLHERLEAETKEESDVEKERLSRTS